MMYFSNISNAELLHFHGTGGVDFSMSLTDILTSHLFKVESVVDDSIYRVYPLFYCKNIISSNVNDIILDNRCLILQKRQQETYLSFITNEKSNVVLDESILNIKNIGDVLSAEEFNALVYLLRQRSNIKGALNFEKNINIKGIYANYEFKNVDGQLKNDTGVIVNNKIKNNPLTVKLYNPFFINARYTLTFTIKSISGANVCQEGKAEFIVIDTFNIELVENTDVPIPLNDYINDSVLDFDVDVTVSFNVPEIVNSNFDLEISADVNDILIGEEINLTATLNGNDNIEGYVVNFFEDNVLIGSQTSNSNGIAILNYTPRAVGNHIYSVSVVGLKSEINISVNKLSTVLSMNVNKESIVYGETITLGGSLLVNNQAVENLPIKLYDNNILIDTLSTDSNGNVSFTSNNLDAGNNNLKLVYYETSDHKTSNASISVIVKIPTNIAILSYTLPPIYAYDTTYRIEGILYNDLDKSPISNKSINIQLDGKGNVVTVTTDENGVFNHHRGMSSGNHNLICTFNGDTYYNSSIISQAVTSIRRHTEFIDVVIKPDTISGYLIQSDTQKPITKSRVEVHYDENYVNGTTTDDNGYFSDTLRNGGANYCPKVWNSLYYDGDYYNDVAELDLSGFSIIRTSSFVDISQNSPSSESFHHVGKLIDDLGNPIANATITIILISNNYSFTRVTDANGLFTVDTAQDTGIECFYKGDEGIEGCSGIVH